MSTADEVMLDGEAVMWCRPLNGILVAQRISLPQMWISTAVLAFHIFFCWCVWARQLFGSAMR